jgi:MFS family permease
LALSWRDHHPSVRCSAQLHRRPRGERAALGASASTSNLAALLGLRILVDAAGALSFVAGAGLVAQLNTGTGPSRAPQLLGVYFAGGGAGIVVSGLTIPALLTHTNGDGWRAGWLLLAGLAAVALAGSISAVRTAHERPPRRPAWTDGRPAAWSP